MQLAFLTSAFIYPVTPHSIINGAVQSLKTLEPRVIEILSRSSLDFSSLKPPLMIDNTSEVISLDHMPFLSNPKHELLGHTEVSTLRSNGANVGSTVNLVYTRDIVVL